MIDKIRIQNFKCLRDVEVELGPLNVLIGPNDSGKTSFLEAIRLLGETVMSWQEDLNTSRFPLGELVWQKRPDLAIEYKVEGTTGTRFEYRLSLSPARQIVLDEALYIDGKCAFDSRGAEQEVAYGRLRVPVGTRPSTYLSLFAREEEGLREIPHPLLDVANALKSSELYRFSPREMRLHARAEVNPRLNTTGSNLAAALLALLSGPDRGPVNGVEEQLHRAVPTLKSIAAPLVDSKEARHGIRFALSENSSPSVTIPSSQVSDGAILLLGYLVLAYGDTPQILLVEEPENGLHPSVLRTVIDLLRRISKGEVGSQPRQVILTTHSPLMLNFAQPEEVRIFRRDEHQETKVVRMADIPNIERLSKEFAPGELWYLFGEEDLIKGQAT